MRVMLVHPEGSNWIPGKKDVTATANRMAPLGLLSLAAVLSQAGHEVKVYDCLGPYAKTGADRQAAEILSFRPDFVGFSATTSGFLNAYQLAQAVKHCAPQVKTVFGGVHISALGALLMPDYPLMDYLCIGEGEGVMLDLAAGLDPKAIDGLVYWDQGKPVTNPARKPIENLDDLPFPAYEKLAGFPRKYSLPLFSYIRAPGATMITSRGCPYQCSYCDRSVFKRIYRYNSAAYIYEHIRYLRRRFNVRHINIYDDLFTTQRKRIMELCHKLIERPLGVRFNCAVRVGHADDELLKMLRQAGFLQLSLGIETGDEALMETHKPGVSLDQVKDTIRRIQAHGLRAKGLFMMGLPGETEASIRKTSDFVLSLGLDDMNMSKFTPFYGAPVWSTIAEYGDLDPDWNKANCLNFVFLPQAIASRERLDELYNRHVKRFYSDKVWRQRFSRRLWEHRHSLWRLIANLPTFMAAMNTFEPKRPSAATAKSSPAGRFVS